MYVHFDSFFCLLCALVRPIIVKLSIYLIQSRMRLCIIFNVVRSRPSTLSRVLVFNLLRWRANAILWYFINRSVAFYGGIRIMRMQRGFLVEEVRGIRIWNTSLTCSSNSQLKAIESWRIFRHLRDWRVCRCSRVRWCATREILWKWIVLLIFHLLAVHLSWLHLLMIKITLFLRKRTQWFHLKWFAEFQWDADITNLQPLAFQTKSIHWSIGVTGCPSLAVHEKRVLKFRFYVNLRRKKSQWSLKLIYQNVTFDLLLSP